MGALSFVVGGGGLELVIITKVGGEEGKGGGVSFFCPGFLLMRYRPLCFVIKNNGIPSLTK